MTWYKSVYAIAQLIIRWFLSIWGETWIQSNQLHFKRTKEW